MSPMWRTGTIRLRPGYTFRDSNGAATGTADGDFAIEGGYVHVRVPGAPLVQVVGAPAVELITYTEA
ncbi:hypothetical protein [Yinghuangia sp. YIM S09857]|uniref:hypothetical protein n=1 Tax=Yinghuangia sp. YIM S09857 TaxID=3436929 RepID=UPI003F52BA89